MSVIRSYSDVIGPRFLLKVSTSNGSADLGNDLIPYISKFEYTDDTVKNSSLHLTVLNPGLRFTNDPRFRDGVVYEVVFGYLSDMSDIHTAVFTRGKPSYPQNGMPTIEIVAYGLSKQLNMRGKATNYGPVSSSFVAQRVAAEYKLDTDIKDSCDARSQSRIQPAGVTDFQYLLSLAHKLNWDCFIRGFTLHFHPKDFTQVAKLEFQYFTDKTGSLLKFEPEVNLTKPNGMGQAGASTRTGATSSVDSKDIDTRDRWSLNTVTPDSGKMVVVGTAGRPIQQQGGTVAAIGGIVSFTFDGTRHNTNTYDALFRNEEEFMSAPSPEADPSAASVYGKAANQRINMDTEKATAEIIGCPRVIGGSIVRFTGVDSAYSGNWRVKTAKHTITAKDGYKTTLTMHKDVGNGSNASQNKSDTKSPHTIDTAAAPTHDLNTITPYSVTVASASGSASRIPLGR